MPFKAEEQVASVLPADQRQRLAEGAAALFPEVQRLRRELHQHPELSNQEEWTGCFLADYLRRLGLTVRTAIAGHGVVADLPGETAGPTLAFRADMDALPLQEPQLHPWSSRRPGVMHACGHDFHMAIGLGAARLLAAQRDLWTGRLRFIFQPAEEGLPPGVPGGAELMIQEGVLEDPAVAAIVGLHVTPGLLVGQLGYCPEIVMAGAERLTLTIQGRQAHAATPHHGIDAIQVAAQALVLLSGLLAQGKDARDPAVLTFGTISGGSRFNILAERVTLEGTLRYQEPRLREQLLTRMHQVLQGLAAATGAGINLANQALYPVLRNDPELARQAWQLLAAHFPAEALRLVRPVMGSEDFAFFAQRVPGFYFFLGTRTPGARVQSLHSPDFDPDERALIVGVTAVALLLAGLSRAWS